MALDLVGCADCDDATVMRASMMTQPELDGLDCRSVCFVKHLIVTAMQALQDAPDPLTSDESRNCELIIS